MYPPSPPQLLVVAAPTEAGGSALTEALRQIGWAVTLATTPEQAAWAARYAGCIVVLTPATRDDPAIQAALAARPARLAPVFAEPMILPYGPWTTSPIRLGEDMVAAARVVIEALFPVATPPAPPTYAPVSPMAPAYPLAPTVAPAGSAHPFAPPASPRQNGRALALALGGAALALLLVVTSVLVLHAGGKGSTLGSIIAAGTPGPAYTAQNPGLGCDQGGALWHATDGVTQNCTAHGTKLSMPSDDGYLQGLFFSLPNILIPLSYRVAVTGTFLQGDSNFEIYVTAHDQQPGDQSFEAFPNSEWRVGRHTTTGKFDRMLSIGFLPKPLKTLRLTVEVDGAVMHFAIDGKTVTTVTDATYQTTADIGFGIYDYRDAHPFAARFSDFVYTPLPNPTVSTSDALATATAQAAQQDRTPYRAAVPGFGCDHGGAQWSPIAISGDGATKLTCTASGMQLDHSGNTGLLGEEYFYWHDGNFPENYSSAVVVTFLSQATFCGSVVTRQNGFKGYGFRICTDGLWQILKFDAQGHPTRLLSGFVAAQAHHTLLITDIGAQQSFSIDGAIVGSITDGDYLTTDRIALAIDAGPASNGVGTLAFSNFVFTPLP